MNKTNGKISVRQAYIIFILTTLSPSIRIFPTACAEAAKQAAWIAPIIALPAAIFLYSVLAAFFRKSGMTKLGDVFDAALGSIAGKIVLSIYLVWSVILFWLYIRYYAGRLLASIFPNTDIRFFILVMLILVYAASRGSLETFARFTEYLFPLFTVLLIFLFIFLLPEVKFGNVWPVATYDLPKAAFASVRVFALWGYMLLPFFFGDKIADKGQIKKYGVRTVIYIVAMAVFLMITVVGALGPSVASRMSLPFFSAVKLITAIETFDRFESLLLSIWVASDFVLISFFAITILHIIRSLYPPITETKFFATPVIAMGYIGSQYMSLGRFDLEIFTSQFASYTNVAMFYVLPLIVLVVGKLRKKI